EGRAFTDEDRLETVPVIVVGETFARRTWPGTSAVGKRLRGHGFDEKRTIPPWWTVVGVVADVRYRDLRSPSLDVYVPYDQAEFSIGDVVIRTRGPAPAAPRSSVPVLVSSQPLPRAASSRQCCSALVLWTSPR